MHLDPHVRKNVAHKPVSSATNLRGRNQLVAALQHAQKRRRYRSHARGRYHCRFPTFERGYLLLRYAKSWIAIPRIDVCLALALGPQLHFRRRGKGERRCTAYGGAHGCADAMARRFTAVYGRGLGTEFAEVVLGGWLIFHKDTILDARFNPTSTNLAACSPLRTCLGCSMQMHERNCRKTSFLLLRLRRERV